MKKLGEGYDERLRARVRGLPPPLSAVVSHVILLHKRQLRLVLRLVCMKDIIFLRIAHFAASRSLHPQFFLKLI